MPVPAGGTRFGDLVHALLAAVPFGADRAAVDDLASVHGRIVRATDEEVTAASATVARVLSHTIVQRARDAETRGACRREAPVTCMVGRGELVEGVVDLAFEENGEWTVVDYKTDREIAADGEERYKRQVAFYARAIAGAMGQPARGVLVRL
jgi:ATP-dependent exoDNAse (exonuclease V) beta subunit